MPCCAGMCGVAACWNACAGPQFVSGLGLVVHASDSIFIPSLFVLPACRAARVKAHRRQSPLGCSACSHALHIVLTCAELIRFRCRCNVMHLKVLVGVRTSCQFLLLDIYTSSADKQLWLV